MFRSAPIKRLESGDYFRSNEALIDAIRLRDDRLTSAEHLANKFLEVLSGSIFALIFHFLLPLLMFRPRMVTIG